MGKTLFTRVFLTTVLVILLSCILSASLLYSQLGNYIIRTESEELEDVAERVAEITGQFIDDSSAQKWLFRHIETQSRNNRCTVLVMNTNAEIVTMAGGSDYIDVDKLSGSLISKALKGEATSGIADNEAGIAKNTFVCTEPIYVEYNGGSLIMGAVVVCKPMPQIQQARNEVMGLLITSQSIALMIAFLFSFLLARSISRPVSQLNSAAKAVASGDFTKKIEYQPKDEIGELISSFNYMTGALKEIDEARSSFVSNVAHELRTPMTIISGFVEGIIDGTIGEDERDKYLNIVLSESRRLGRLVNDLLQTSRLESGTAKLVMKQIDINEMLRKGVISYENAITEKKLDVEVEFKRENCYAVADEDSIYRVVMNLLDNAIKYAPEGGHIKVRTSESVRKVEVSIENSGDGISEKDLAHIWERFYKTDKSRGMDKRGVGLGLYLVKTIINQHNNRIWAESKEGEYTRFTFTLDKPGITGVKS